MATKYYSQLVNEKTSLDSIKNGAQKICDRRGKYASVLFVKVGQIKKEKKEIDDIVSTIRKNASVLGDDRKNELDTLCASLSTSLNLYVEKADNLCKRFGNKKIRLLAFGQASEGKSTFTQQYTGLPQEIVAVKNDNDGQDKTGALSIVYHDNRYKRDNPKIVVHFKTKDEILNTVNSCINNLNKLDFTLPGTTNRIFKSWTDFAGVIKDNKNKEQAYLAVNSLKNNDVKDFTPIKAFLLSVFERESNFDEVKDESSLRTIERKDLPMYNDMTNSNTRKYLSVKHIEIYANLGNDDVFENFEICDSKGISAMAGGKLVEDDVYNEINNSDAAFSIKKVGQSVHAAEFYTNLSNIKVKKTDDAIIPENLDKKHFAILNLIPPVVDDTTLDNVIKTINENNLANCIYVGSLKQIQYRESTIDPVKFSQSVIIDMLSRIVDSVKTSDDSLIEKCNELVNIISNDINNLVESLSKCQKEAEQCNIDTILLENIEKLRCSAIKKLKTLAESNNVPMSDVVDNPKNAKIEIKETTSNSSNGFNPYTNIDCSQNTVKSNEQQVIPKEVLKSLDANKACNNQVLVFKMITGRYDLDDNEVQSILQSKKYNEGSGVVENAISYILEDIKPKAGSTVFIGDNRSNALIVTGTPDTIGGYIDSVCGLLAKRIDRNINEMFSPSKGIDSLGALNNEVYSTVWNTLKLDSVLGNFSGQILEEYKKNEIVNSLSKRYNKRKNEQEASSIIPEMSYNVLVSYFKNENVDYKPTATLEITKPIIDWDLLKQSICDVYKSFDFDGRVKEKQVNEQMLKSNIFVDLIALLSNTTNFAAGIKSIYPNEPEALLKAGLIEQAEYDKISNQSKWHALNQIRELLRNTKVTKLGVIN